MRMRALWVAAALCAAAWAEDRPLSISSAAFETRGGQTYVAAQGRADFPDRTRLVIMLSMDGQTNSDHYTSVYVENGNWKGEIGPFDQQFLPGTYVFLVDFMMGDQHPAIQKALKQAALPAMCLRDVATLVWGDAKDEAAGRAKVSAHYLAGAEEARAIFDEFQSGLADFGSGKRFVKGDGKGWDAASWLPWVDGLLARIDRMIEEQQAIAGDALVGRYLPEAHLVYSSQLTAVRYTIIAHTRAFLREAGMEIGEKYGIPDRAEGPFRDPNRVAATRGMADEVKRIVETWKEAGPDDWAFYKTTPEAEKKMIGEWSLGILMTLRDLVEEMRKKSELEAKGPFDAARWEEIYTDWEKRLKAAVPPRELTKIRMEPGAESLLTFKYPYVLDLIEEMVRNASSYGQSAAAGLYLGAGKPAPRRYFGDLADEAPTPAPSKEDVERELLRWYELFQSRLEHLRGKLGLTLPEPK